MKQKRIKTKEQKKLIVYDGIFKYNYVFNI